jgi:hypothetical protein
MKKSSIDGIIYESLEGSCPTFRWCWQVHELDLVLVCPYPGIWGCTHLCGNIHNVRKIMFSLQIYIWYKLKRDFPSSHGVWRQIYYKMMGIFALKKRNMWGKTRGLMGRSKCGMGLSTHQWPVTCMQASMGFVVGVRVVFSVVVGPVLGACIPVISKLILGCVAMPTWTCGAQ